MKRSQFLLSIAAIAASQLIGLPEFSGDKNEFLRKYPLAEKECFRHFIWAEIDCHVGDMVMDENMLMLYCVSLKENKGQLFYLNSEDCKKPIGSQFVVFKSCFQEG